MKKLIIIALTVMSVACNRQPQGEFRIHGTVNDPKLEGAQVFLVPTVGAVKENIDSVVITNMKFEFKGTIERVSDIRIEKLKRMGTQNLLVVTEPGDIYVTIDAVSVGRGTPQNDSLQVWKDLTMKRNMDLALLPKNVSRATVDSINNAFAERTRQMVRNLNEGTLHDFLNGLYPQK